MTLWWRNTSVLIYSETKNLSCLWMWHLRSSYFRMGSNPSAMVSRMRTHFNHLCRQESHELGALQSLHCKTLPEGLWIIVSDVYGSSRCSRWNGCNFSNFQFHFMKLGVVRIISTGTNIREVKKNWWYTAILLGLEKATEIYLLYLKWLYLNFAEIL